MHLYTLYDCLQHCYNTAGIELYCMLRDLMLLLMFMMMIIIIINIKTSDFYTYSIPFTNYMFIACVLIHTTANMIVYMFANRFAY